MFDGWFTGDDYQTPFDFAPGIDADTTVFAKWTVVDPSLALELSLTIGDVAAGTTATVAGEGMQADSAYDLSVASAPTTIAFGSISSDGSFSNSGVIPAGLEAGTHTVTLSATASDGTALTRLAFFSIDSAGVVTYFSYTEAETVSETAALAVTGFDGAPLGFAAMLLLLAGAALVLRRRQSVK